MTSPTQETVKQEYRYQTDQQASINGFFDVDIDGEPVRLQITARYGSTAPKIVQTTEAMIEAYKTLRAMHPKPIGAQAPGPQLDPAVKIALEEGNKPLAAELKAQAAEVPPAPDGKEYHTITAAFVKILPQPDNKVTIEFYGDDKKRPHNDYKAVAVNKWPAERAAALMKHVTSADVTKAAEFSLACTVYYTDGKEYNGPNGAGRYKDVQHVR